jgi:hypothetical protein
MEKYVVTDSSTFIVRNYIISYVNETLAYRAVEFFKGKVKPTQLFVSWATIHPVN